mgnify:CR=1 FL=1
MVPVVVACIYWESLLGGPLWQSAAHGLRRGVLSTDLLLLAGTVAAFVQSAISVFRDGGPITRSDYAEVATTLILEGIKSVR